MTCRITNATVDARDPRRLAAFWAAVLGYTTLVESDEEVEIGPPGTGFGGAQPTLVFGAGVPASERAKPPLHLDLSPEDDDHRAEPARLLALGAQRADIGQSGEEPWSVLADPEGNTFCLMHKAVAPLG